MAANNSLPARSFDVHHEGPEALIIERDGLIIHKVEQGASFRVTVSGRDRWALECLIAAGPKGCTTVSSPAPRLSAYVHNLRGAGVPIHTHHEPHEGPFPGTHARYTLSANVTPYAPGGDA